MHPSSTVQGPGDLPRVCPLLRALSGYFSPIIEEVEKELLEAGMPWVVAHSGHSLAWVARS